MMKQYAKPPDTPFSLNIFFQMAGYALVAFAGFAVDYLLLALLGEGLGLNYLLAAPPAFVLGLAANFLLGKRWVFGASRYKTAPELGVFCLVSLAALGITEGGMYLMSGVWGLHYLLSKLVTGALTFGWNFAARRWLLYPRKNQGAPPKDGC